MNTFTELAISIRTSGGRVRRQVRPHPGVLSIALGLVVLACSARASYLKDKQVFWSRSQPLWEVSARIEWDRRRIQRTVDALKRALHERPSDYRLAVQLADLYFKLRNYAESTRLLKQYAHLSSPEDNMYGRLGLNYDLAHEYRKALGYYYKALQVDRQRFDIYVRIAQVRIKQGLPVDAARVLKKVLDVDPDYTPAVEEMKVVRRVIRSNAANVYRGANMVITYDDFHQLNEVDTFFPFMEAHASLLEERLKYHIPTIWIKIVPRVELGDHQPDPHQSHDHPGRHGTDFRGRRFSVQLAGQSPVAG